MSYSRTQKKTLGVNVDHVATIRQMRGTSFPDPIEAAIQAIKGGADQITIHLREDRRHIQDRDVSRMKETIDVPLNLEMSINEEIVDIACNIKPNVSTLVPEKREELTTEGGLDVVSLFDRVKNVTSRLKSQGVRVSLFIDPEEEQVKASVDVGADAIEFHTGTYSGARTVAASQLELDKLITAVNFAGETNLTICAGHGLSFDNTAIVVESLPLVTEYNIGHSIIARSIYVGIEQAVSEMKSIILGRSQ